MAPMMDTMEIEQVTTILLLILLLRRRKRRRYEACKRPIKKQRRGPLKRERLRWDYDELTDAVFRANYRMSKEKFKILVSKVGPHLPGWTELSRTRQAAAGGGNPIVAELQISMAIRYLAGGSYLRTYGVPRRLASLAFPMRVREAFLIMFLPIVVLLLPP